MDTEKLIAGIPSENLDIGIAEYSNANFFSDDTLFDQNYQTPTDIGLGEEVVAGGSLRRYLYRHPGSSFPTRYKLAVASRFSSFLTIPFQSRQWDLDDLVMEDYGKKLFPRAIGYSAGLIDYFFDGQVMASIGNGVFATATGYAIEFLGSDFSPGFPNPKQPAGTGTIVLVLLPKSIATGVTSRHVSQPQTVTIVPTVNEGGIPRVDLSMNFSSNPLPLRSVCCPSGPPEWGDYQWEGYVVWRGPLAQLIGGQVTIVEQDGVTISGNLGFWYD